MKMSIFVETITHHLVGWMSNWMPQSHRRRLMWVLWRWTAANCVLNYRLIFRHVFSIATNANEKWKLICIGIRLDHYTSTKSNLPDTYYLRPAGQGIQIHSIVRRLENFYRTRTTTIWNVDILFCVTLGIHDEKWVLISLIIPDMEHDCCAQFNDAPNINRNKHRSTTP